MAKQVDRPPITNPPGGMPPPPPSLGDELEGKQSDSRPKVVTDETTNPERQSPNAPSPLAVGVPNAPNPQGGPQEFPDGMPDEPASLVEARQRAEKANGNVYLVKTTLTTGHKGHVTESDFIGADGKPTADVAWLVKAGALEPVGPLKSDPSMTRALGQKGIEEIDRLQARNNELQADNDRLNEENAKLRKDNDRLRGI